MVSEKWWGSRNSKDIYLYTITNNKGDIVQLTNLGAGIIQVVVPDIREKRRNVVLGYGSIDGYLNDDNYMGVTIGRFANRIAGAQFKIGGNKYYLDANEGVNCNHGGFEGLHTQVFDVTMGENSVRFTFLSPDGAGGFPGNLNLSVTYFWNDEKELLIRYFAETDKPTILNLTNHSYFNLSGGLTDIFSHHLTINASGKLKLAEDNIPTGVVLPLKANKEAQSGHKQGDIYRLSLNEAMNDCYIINGGHSSCNKVCTIWDSNSGIRMHVFSTYPGLILYTGDYLESKAKGMNGRSLKAFDGVCLECQYFPDSPNQPEFPSVLLPLGVPYNESIMYKFDLISDENNDLNGDFADECGAHRRDG